LLLFFNQKKTAEDYRMIEIYGNVAPLRHVNIGSDDSKVVILILTTKIARDNQIS